MTQQLKTLAEQACQPKLESTKSLFKKKQCQLGSCNFSPSIQEAEAGRSEFECSRDTTSTQLVPGQQGMYS